MPSPRCPRGRAKRCGAVRSPTACRPTVIRWRCSARRGGRLRGPRLPGLPPLTGGFVGYLAYDVVRRIETLPQKAEDDLGLPELTMLLVTDLAAVDHHRVHRHAHRQRCRALRDVEPASSTPRTPTRAAGWIAMQAALATPAAPTVADDRPARTQGRRVPHADRGVPARRRAGARGRAGRRGVPDPGWPAVPGRHGRGRIRRLPGAAHAQPVAVHVLPAAAWPRHRRAPARRRWSPSRTA